MSIDRESSVKLQCAPAVLMLRPARFGFNAQTAPSNRFQHDDSAGGDPNHALLEFASFASALADAGVRTCVVDDTPEPQKPDAVFPNNWVSFHGDGTIVLYPMQAANRRLERRPDVLASVESAIGFRCSHLLDLSGEESHGRFLEGTGSLVLDHVERVAYACRSPRTDEALVREWAQALRYQPEIFDAAGTDGAAVYHTNVLLSIGSRYALLCSDALARADRVRVRARLQASGRQLIEISRRAMHEFAGNVLELRAQAPARPGQSLMVMSMRARAALDALQWQQINESVERVLVVALPTIETLGGGGARCMLAEVPEIAA
ncbi:MAG: arginine deiminase-related protein [Steroidobacteraceae bacterium]